MNIQIKEPAGIKLALAVVIALSIAGCGGGGSKTTGTNERSAALTTASASKSSPAASTQPNYLQLVFPTYSYDNSTPENIDTPLFLLDGEEKHKLRKTVTVTENVPRMDTGESLGSSIAVTEAVRFADPAIRHLGDAVLAYVHQRKLMKISLKTTDSHTPRQISSLDDVCAIVDQKEINTDGTDAVIAVRRAAADNSCSVGNPGLLAYVRLTDDASTAPTTFPNGIMVNDIVVDRPAGKFLGYLVNLNKHKLALIDSDGVRSPVTGANDVTVAWASTLSTSDAFYAGKDIYFGKNGVYRLRKSGTKFFLRTLHSFPKPMENVSTIVCASDSKNFFFFDDLTLYSIDNADKKKTLATVPSRPRSLKMGKGRLFVVDSKSIATVPITGGGRRILFSNAIDEVSYIEGVNGKNLFFVNYPLSRTSSTLYVVAADGSHSAKKILPSTNLSDVMPIYNPVKNNVREIDGFVLVVGKYEYPDYQAHSKLVQYETENGRLTTLGRFNSTASNFSAYEVYSRPFSDRPFFLGASGYHGYNLANDVYFARFNTPNSLLNVTKTLN